MNFDFKKQFLCQTAVMLMFFPFWFGRQQFQKHFLISSLVEETKLELVRCLTNLIGEIKCLKRSLNKKGCLWGGGVCACTCTPACLWHTYSHFGFIWRWGKGAYLLCIPRIPWVFRHSGMIAAKKNKKTKEWDEQSERRTVEGISHLNISGMFPSSSPECLHQTLLSL